MLLRAALVGAALLFLPSLALAQSDDYCAHLPSDAPSLTHKECVCRQHMATLIYSRGVKTGSHFLPGFEACDAIDAQWHGDATEAGKFSAWQQSRAAARSAALKARQSADQSIINGK